MHNNRSLSERLSAPSSLQGARSCGRYKVIQDQEKMCSLIGKVNALSVFSAWILLPCSFIWLAYQKYFGDPEGSAMPFILMFSAFLVSALVHLVLAYFVRCPNCGKCLTIQGLSAPNVPSDSSWSKVIWHWFSGSVVCFHCGSHVSTKGL